MNKRLDVNDWVAMFRDIGLDQAKMEQWHRLFEARHPAGHQEFSSFSRLSPERSGENTQPEQGRR